MEKLFFLWGIVILSSETAGLTCREQCGGTREDCSSNATCLSMKNCCVDFNQSCFLLNPSSSSMLGGRALNILNLILPLDGQLICRFKGEIKREGFIDEEGRAYCISPLLYETGWIPVDVSTDGTDFVSSGEYLAVRPSKMDPYFEVTLVNATLWQNYGMPNMAGPLKMTWISSLIPSEKVNVELWGYREVNVVTAGGTSTRGELSYLYSLGRRIPNTGEFSFTPEPRRDFSDWLLGNIRITTGSKHDGESNVEALWSAAHVLAWHLQQEFRDDPAVWAQTQCLRWDASEKTLPDFVDELFDCPCTLTQARADTGRFHTDYSCNMETGSVCTYHPSSVHCVRAIQASPSSGSGQQCCYDSFGSLLLTGDSRGGGTPDRAHDWGSPPYRVPPRIPGYSHWLYDLTSFCYCCLWSDLCHVYLKHRPSSDCRRYEPPRAGAAFGALHFLTFDGVSYTFNGRGEYQLVSAADRRLTVQARTQQVKHENGTLIKATQLSSVSMRENSSDVIEVRLVERCLQLLRNQKILAVAEQKWMELKGVFVFVPSPHVVDVIFPSGAAVELRLYGGSMAATVRLPAEFSNRTQGLLGPMNSDPSDDLTTPHGEVILSATATPEEIFSFGAGWNISKPSSLFTYESKQLLDTYFSPPSHDSDFVPAFVPYEKPNDPLLADTLSMCSGDGALLCKHDTLLTRSLEVGNATLKAHHNHHALMEALQPVVSCGWLPTPRNGEKNGTRYLQGDTLSFSCGEGYTLFRSSVRTCQSDGTWTGEQTHCITEDTVGIILGTMASLSAMITMGTIIKLHNRKPNRKRRGETVEMVA